MSDMTAGRLEGNGMIIAPHKFVFLKFNKINFVILSSKYTSTYQ